jgi:plasmid stability protein
MPAVTIRNLSEETHRALKRRAKLRGNSTEGEIRRILEEAIRPESRVKVGSELAKFGKSLGKGPTAVRDPRPTEAAEFD